MYEADGIDLSRSEYEEVVALVGCEGDVARFAQGRIDADHSLVPVYWSLHERGMVSGARVVNSYVFRELPRKAPDWLASYEKGIADAKRLSRREIKLAVWNAVGGAIAGGLVAWALYALFGIG